jgi:hypothetical protein
VSLIVQSSGAELEVLVVGVVLVPVDTVLHEVDLVLDRVIPVVVGLLQVVTVTNYRLHLVYTVF